MAHCDYACCAICARKLWYDSGCDDHHKTQLCQACSKSMYEQGHPVFSPKELIAWIESEEPTERERTLAVVGYEPCAYETVVDDAVANARKTRPAPEDEAPL